MKRFLYLSIPIYTLNIGSAFSKEVLLSELVKERHKSDQPEYQKNPLAIFSYPSDLHLVVDLQKCVKAQQSAAYARKVKISNLQQMAETLIFLEENHIDSLEQLQHESDLISKQIDDLSNQKIDMQTQITSLNKKIHYLGQYHVNKKYFSSMLKSDNKADYRKRHSDKITKYEEALNFLKLTYPNSDFPTLEHLKEKRRKILTDAKIISRTLHSYYEQRKSLSTSLHNVNIILSNQKRLIKEKKTESYQL